MKSKLAIRIVAGAVVATLLIWMLARVDWSELGRRLVGASLTDLVIMAVVWISAWLLRPIRFRYLLRTLGHIEGVDYGTVWASMALCATVNSLLPMRAGDAVQTVFLRQRLGIGVHLSVSVILTDLICDFLCVVATFVGALSFAPAVVTWTDHAVTALIGLSAIALACGWAVMRHRRPIVAMLDSRLARLAPRWRMPIVTRSDEFLTALATIGTWKTAGTLMVISLLIWGLTAVSYWFGLRAVFEGVPVAAAPFSMATVALSFVVPLGPGGLGAFEAATVLGLQVFAVPLEAALAFAVIAHAFQFGCTVLFGALAVVVRQVDFQSLRTTKPGD